MTLEQLLPRLVAVERRDIKNGWTRVTGTLPKNTPIPPGVFITRSRTTVKDGYHQEDDLPSWARSLDYRMTGAEYQANGYPSDLFIIMDLRLEQENEFGTISP